MKNRNIPIARICTTALFTLRTTENVTDNRCESHRDGGEKRQHDGKPAQLPQHRLGAPTRVAMFVPVSTTCLINVRRQNASRVPIGVGQFFGRHDCRLVLSDILSSLHIRDHLNVVGLHDRLGWSRDRKGYASDESTSRTLSPRDAISGSRYVLRIRYARLVAGRQCM